MRYIRTKDGRLIDTTKRGVLLGYHPRESDNIPELCDEFVLVVKNMPPKLITDLIRKGNLFVNADVYGAIWIKGKYGKPILKSVVKMKGVLPNGEIDWKLL